MGNLSHLEIRTEKKEMVKEEKILETRRFSLKTIWSFLSNLSLETPVDTKPLHQSSPFLKIYV